MAVASQRRLHYWRVFTGGCCVCCNESGVTLAPLEAQTGSARIGALAVRQVYGGGKALLRLASLREAGSGVRKLRRDHADIRKLGLNERRHPFIAVTDAMAREVFAVGTSRAHGFKIGTCGRPAAVHRGDVGVHG